MWLRYGWRGEGKRCGCPRVLATVEADPHNVVVVVVDPHEAVDDVNGHREDDGGVVLR